VTKTLPEFSQNKVPDVVACLQKGGVVLLPTDTVLGLAVLPSSSEAVEKLYNLKARPKEKALPIMASNSDQLESLGLIVSPSVEKLLNSPLVPGGLTIVANLNPKTCPDWLRGRKEIAFRIPNFEFLLDVLGQTGPLLVTSANLAGNYTPKTTSEVLKQLNGAPDLVVTGKMLTDTPSTLVNCTKTLSVVERIGAIPVAEILKWIKLNNG
jgi:L-threonylcarbamoyladenylate synthase